jgi:hypothetical protein
MVDNLKVGKQDCLTMVADRNEVDLLDSDHHQKVNDEFAADL